MTHQQLTKERNIFLGFFILLNILPSWIFRMLVTRRVIDDIVVSQKIMFFSTKLVLVYLVFRLSRFLGLPVGVIAACCIIALLPWPILSFLLAVGLLIMVGVKRRTLGARGTRDKFSVLEITPIDWQLLILSAVIAFSFIFMPYVGMTEQSANWGSDDSWSRTMTGISLIGHSGSLGLRINSILNLVFPFLIVFYWVMKKVFLIKTPLKTEAIALVVGILGFVLHMLLKEHLSGRGATMLTNYGYSVGNGFFVTATMYGVLAAICLFKLFGLDFGIFLRTLWRKMLSAASDNK